MLLETNQQILEKNSDAVYSLFFEHLNLSKPQVAKLSGLSMPTVMSHIKRLENEGLISKGENISSDIGRPARAYTLVVDAKVALGVEITSEFIKCAAFNLKAQLIGYKNYPIKCSNTVEYFDSICAFITSFYQDLGIEKSRILGIGISIQAIVDSQGQHIIYSEILPIKDIDVKRFSQTIGLPCRLFHDVECATINELWFSSTLSDAIFISISEHLGGCLIKDHKIEYGKFGYAGALEHMQIHQHGRTCYCGKQGCLEAYCSMLSLQNESHENVHDFFIKLRANDPKALEIWNEYINNLSIALSNVYLLLDRDIILGGEIALYLNNHDTQRLEAIIKSRTSFKIQDGFIRIAKIDQNATVLGAALFYLSKHLPANLIKVVF